MGAWGAWGPVCLLRAAAGAPWRGLGVGHPGSSPGSGMQLQHSPPCPASLWLTCCAARALPVPRPRPPPAGIPVEDIVMAEWRSSVFRPCHYLAVDRARRRLVLVVRGSLELSDIATDLTARWAAVGCGVGCGGWCGGGGGMVAVDGCGRFTRTAPPGSAQSVCALVCVQRAHGTTLAVTAGVLGQGHGECPGCGQPMRGSFDPPLPRLPWPLHFPCIWCRPIEFDFGGGLLGHVHQGLMSAATYVHLNTAQALRTAAERFAGWPLLVTGAGGRAAGLHCTGGRAG